ncbi:DnaJ- protein scj1 [Malassezia equina]|uniref:DnaJ- protein scj1 n=1 Tax=Malassezia equina TaxID=1381935 RepID=A0AAF0EHS0_9BASI|nr:DnaJ- protein scj1 [Malassezia equina]
MLARVSTTALLLGLLVYLPLLVAAARDWYEVLGVSRHASERDIKSAYRKKARHIHPDKHPDRAEEFMELTEAYQTLSDPELRSIYDRYGADAAQQHQAKKDSGHQDPLDLFRQFFGGGASGGADTTPKGPTKIYQASVPLADVYIGRSFTIEHERTVVCPACFGSGAHSSEHIHTCSQCQGRGVQMMRQQIMPGFVTNVQMQCPHCNGAGRTIAKLCGRCRGQRVLHDKTEIEVEVEAGAREGYEYVLEEMGDQSPDMEAGDVVVQVTSDAGPGDLRRLGHHLYTTEALSLHEALLGFDRTFHHYDGHTVRLRRTEVTQPGFVMRVEDEGMPIPVDERDQAGGRLHGDLFVEFRVVLPKLDAEARAQLGQVLAPPMAHTEL